MLERLQLENFRNHTGAQFSFAPLTVLVGNNGAGKTSVLEAISMLSLTTSWRTEKDIEVIGWGQPHTRVLAGDLELVIQRHPYFKRIRIDGVSKRTYQVVGHFPTVLFQPDDILLLYGSPTVRRHYLDRLLSQTSSSYTRAIVELQRVLKQRNRLLKNIEEGTASPAELLFWDEQLAGIHAIIRPQRQEFIRYLNLKLPHIFNEMVPSTLPIEVHYVASPHEDVEYFLQHLLTNRFKELASGVSLYGPHREDIQMKWGEHPAEQAMSRGQSRALMLAFKIAELDYITEHTEYKPVLLLDDIFSELDAERRGRLLQVFGDYQVIMTTTELDTTEKILGDQAQVIEVV